MVHSMEFRQYELRSPPSSLFDMLRSTLVACSATKMFNSKNYETKVPNSRKSEEVQLVRVTHPESTHTRLQNHDDGSDWGTNELYGCRAGSKLMTSTVAIDCAPSS